MQKKKVCVTGASGFIAGHTIFELLQRGYEVVGTVRDANDTQKTKHLLDMQQQTQGTLSLVSADLMVPHSFDAIVKDCDVVFHMASAVRLTAKNPQKDIVDVALQGTLNVFQSIAKSEKAKRVVLTSSIAAVIDENKNKDYVFTEKDWNESSSVEQSPYPHSKKLAEKAAFDFVESLPQEKRFSLTAIHPSFCLGPCFTSAHVRSSPSIVKRLMKKEFPLCPQLFFNSVDVRDVALAHVLAMETPNPSPRYICSTEPLPMKEIGKILKQKHPELPIPTKEMPNWIMYIVALFDSSLSLSFLKRNLGIVRKLDNQKIQKELGIRFRSLETSIQDTAKSLLDNNLL